MGDMYSFDNNNVHNNNNYNCRNYEHGPYGHDLNSSSDEISHFVNQILLRSSSSNNSLMAQSGSSLPAPLCTTATTVTVHQQDHDHHLSFGINGAGSFSGNAKTDMSNATSFGVGGGGGGGGSFENEIDEFDGESEEGFEAFVDETVPVVANGDTVSRHRGSSKRSRAAEIHNLSEKRRRSRINEKMKALQNLIPNSNKTDKASMLDDAIEYLKQLQLQVQMLSMRNGVSLHPMCLPGLLHSMEQSNTTETIPVDQEALVQTVLGLANQRPATNELLEPAMSNTFNLDSSFSLEPSTQDSFVPFVLSEEICGDNISPHQRPTSFHHERNSSDFEVACNEKDSNSLIACIIGRNMSADELLKDMEHNLVVSPNLIDIRPEQKP